MQNPTWNVERLQPSHVLPQEAEDLSALMRQLSPEKDRGESMQMVAGITCHPEVYVVRDPVSHRIVGTATLVVSTLFGETTGRVENVVVDFDHYRQGIAKQLMAQLRARAHELQMTYLDLTSKRTREAAHRLYEQLGFKLRDTNVYRLTLSD